MLSSDQFLVLGEVLLPPEGYEVDALIATTFSLDFATAVGLPLALIRQGQFVGATVESTSRLAVIEALKRFAGRYRVFCDAAGIHVPSRRWRGLSLLDQVVVPVAMPERPARAGRDPGHARPRFHPKLVLVRFVRKGVPARLRIVCMSRNLTSDAALDVSVVIEGETGRPDGSQGSDRLADAVEALLPWAVRQDQRVGAHDLVTSIVASVRRTLWQAPDGFQTVAFWPFGPAATPDPVTLRADEQRLLVASPFLSRRRLSALTASGRGHVLISTPEALVGVGTKALKDFDEVYHLSSTAEFGPPVPTTDDVTPVAEADAPTVTGLHAKLYIAEGPRRTRWVIGSGNATEAAVKGNAELLVELQATSKPSRIDHLIDPVDGLGRHLVPYVPDPGDPEEPTPASNEAEVALRALSSSSFRGVVELVAEGRYQLDILLDPLLIPTANVAFAARLTGRDMGFVPLRPDRAPAARISNVVRADLSPYLVVTAVAGDERLERVVALALEGVTAQELADEAVVREVRRHDPLDYIAFVLSESEELEYGLTFDEDDPEEGGLPPGDGAGRSAPVALQALLEPLLRLLLDRDPDSLGQQRLADLEEAIGAFGDEIPIEFRQMWDAIRRVRALQ